MARNDYVARCPKCSRIVAWMSQTLEDDPKSLAREIGKWVRAGLSSERCLNSDLPAAAEWGHSDDCENKPRNKRKKKKPAETPLFGTA